MSTRKPRSRNNQHHAASQPSDYETDAPTLEMLPPPSRSNTELNLSVIRRQNPLVTDILAIAPYAVVYMFSPDTQNWDKTGVEGTLFVCRLSPSPIGADRYSVMILNRRGLDNFSAELLNTDDVELSNDYVMVQVTGEDENTQIYGLWIFSEPPPSSTAKTKEIISQVIMDCATQAELSRKAIEQRLAEADADGPEDQTEEEEPQSVPMGRQLSLRELFGQVRQEDAGWSVHNHTTPPTLRVTPQFAATADTEFFRSKSRTEQTRVTPKVAQTTVHSQADNSDVLLALFKKAKDVQNPH